MKPHKICVELPTRLDVNTEINKPLFQYSTLPSFMYTGDNIIL